MSPFEAYLLYIALRNHFKLKTYDFFKYNGRTNATIESFTRRSDKWIFEKLAKLPDPKGYLVANFVALERMGSERPQMKFRPPQFFPDYEERQADHREAIRLARLARLGYGCEDIHVKTGMERSAAWRLVQYTARRGWHTVNQTA